MSGLVAHAAGLAAHAQRTSLASVLRAHRLPQLPPADTVGHAQRVRNRLPTTAAFHPLHHCSRKVRSLDLEKGQNHCAYPGYDYTTPLRLCPIVPLTALGRAGCGRCKGRKLLLAAIRGSVVESSNGSREQFGAVTENRELMTPNRGGSPIVRRVGTPRLGVSEVPLADLHPLHPVPRLGMPPNHISDLANAIRTNGYDLGQAIPVARMPDGRLLQLGGHHRAAAMGQLGEITIPARVVVWNSLSPRVQNWWRSQFPNLPWDDFIR